MGRFDSHKVGLLGAGVAILSLLLPWYEQFGIDISAFDSPFFAWAGPISAAIGGLLAAPKDSSRERAAYALILAAIGLGMVIVQLLTDPEFVRLGLYIGLLGGAVCVAAAANRRPGSSGSPSAEEPTS